jgi:predicted DNA-binding WGR domain protein
METFSKIGEAVAARDKLEQVKRRKGYRGQV